MPVAKHRGEVYNETMNAEKRPLPRDPWAGLMFAAVFLTVGAPVFAITRLFAPQPGPALFGFFAGTIAVLLLTRRYEGEWSWGDGP